MQSTRSIAAGELFRSWPIEWDHASDNEDHPGLRIALFHLRKLLFCALDRLVQRRVAPAYLDGYIDGKIDPVDPVDDLSEAGFFHALDHGDPETINRVLVGAGIAVSELRPERASLEKVFLELTQDEEAA